MNLWDTSVPSSGTNQFPLQLTSNLWGYPLRLPCLFSEFATNFSIWRYFPETANAVAGLLGFFHCVLFPYWLLQIQAERILEDLPSYNFSDATRLSQNTVPCSSVTHASLILHLFSDFFISVGFLGVR